MSINLSNFLKRLNENNNEDIVNTINVLFDIAMFDEDGEFGGWETNGIKEHGGIKEIQKDLEKVKQYLEQHGCRSENKMFYIIFAAGEGKVETEKELIQTIKDVKEMEEL